MAMKTINNPSALFRWNGRLMKVIGYFEGRGKVIEFQPIDAKLCEHCGQTEHYVQTDGSLLFQESAEPVDTLITI